MVLVTRSGIEASRFSPMERSFRKPEMIFRDRKSSCQRASVPSTSHPSAAISALSSCQRLSLKTSSTGTSRSAGASTNACTSAISVL